MLNFALLRSPWNWMTIGLMALFGLVLLAILFPEPEELQS